MQESIKHIAEQIKVARENKGLSQRALSKKVGIPQSHISKIENGTVNLQLSSLIELARVLDLELMLIPKKNSKATLSLNKSKIETASDLEIIFDALSKIPFRQLQQFAQLYLGNNSEEPVIFAGRGPTTHAIIEHLRKNPIDLKELRNKFSHIPANKVIDTFSYTKPKFNIDKPKYQLDDED